MAKSYARIHYSNLINLGIIPLTFADAADFETLQQGDELQISGIHSALRAGKMAVQNLTRNTTFEMTFDFTGRQVEILMAGGLLNFIRKGGK